MSRHELLSRPSNATPSTPTGWMGLSEKGWCDWNTSALGENWKTTWFKVQWSLWNVMFFEVFVISRDTFAQQKMSTRYKPVFRYTIQFSFPSLLLLLLLLLLFGIYYVPTDLPKATWCGFLCSCSSCLSSPSGRFWVAGNVMVMSWTKSCTTWDG